MTKRTPTKNEAKTKDNRFSGQPWQPWPAGGIAQ
jgi:hypothetical protein